MWQDYQLYEETVEAQKDVDSNDATFTESKPFDYIMPDKLLLGGTPAQCVGCHDFPLTSAAEKKELRGCGRIAHEIFEASKNPVIGAMFACGEFAIFGMFSNFFGPKASATATGVSHGDQLVLAAAAGSTDVCLENVSGQQPFWLVIFATAVKQLITNIAFPTNSKDLLKPMKLHQIGLSVATIVFSVRILVKDITFARSVPSHCYLLVVLGSQQMISVFQCINSWALFIFAKVSNDETTTSNLRYYLLMAWTLVVIPYLPVAIVANVVLVLPALWHFFLFVFTAMTLASVIFGLGYFALNMVVLAPKDGETETEGDGKVCVLILSLVQGAYVPTVANAKFLAEAMMRFQEPGTTHWQAVWKTWSERNTIRYGEAVYKSFDSVMNAVQSFI